MTLFVRRCFPLKDRSWSSRCMFGPFLCFCGDAQRSAIPSSVLLLSIVCSPLLVRCSTVLRYCIAPTLFPFSSAWYTLRFSSTYSVVFSAGILLCSVVLQQALPFIFVIRRANQRSFVLRTFFFRSMRCSAIACLALLCASNFCALHPLRVILWYFPPKVTTCHYGATTMLSSSSAAFVRRESRNVVPISTGVNQGIWNASAVLYETTDRA